MKPNKHDRKKLTEVKQRPIEENEIDEFSPEAIFDDPGPTGHGTDICFSDADPGL